MARRIQVRRPREGGWTSEQMAALVEGVGLYRRGSGQISWQLIRANYPMLQKWSAPALKDKKYFGFQKKILKCMAT